MRFIKNIFMLLFGVPLLAETIQPNIVFMLVDDQGWVDLDGFNEYSSTYYYTPNISQLATESVKFTHAYSEPVCAPTRADIMTGMYPSKHHMYTVTNPADNPDNHQLGRRENKDVLGTEFTTIADVLTGKGYRCASIGKWHLYGSANDGEQYHPENRGFEKNIAGDHNGMPYPASEWWSDEYGAFVFPNLPATRIEPIAEGVERDYLTDRLTDEAVATMEEFKASPFYIYLPHYGIHAPTEAPQSDIDIFTDRPADPNHPGHDDSAHAAMIHSIDRSVEKILTYLKTTDDPRNVGHKLIDNTMFVYVSDNGSVTPRSDNLPLRSGKADPYEGGVRVPLMVKWKGYTGECTSVTHVVDWFPTLVELTGGDPTTYSTDGISILPLITGAETTIERAIYRHQPVHVGPGMSSSIREGNYKLIYFYESPGSVYNGAGYYEFYNLDTDIGESNNLVAHVDLTKPQLRSTLPQEFIDMAAKLNTWLTESDAALPYLMGTTTPVDLPALTIVDSIAKEQEVITYSENFDTTATGTADIATGVTATATGINLIGGTVATSGGHDIGAKIAIPANTTTNISGNVYWMVQDTVLAGSETGTDIPDTARHIDITLPTPQDVTIVSFSAYREAAVDGRIAVQYTTDGTNWLWTDGTTVTYTNNLTTPPVASVLEMPAKDVEYNGSFSLSAKPVGVTKIRLITDYKAAVTTARDLYIDSLVISYPSAPVSDIHTTSGWTGDALPTLVAPGGVTVDCNINSVADTNSSVSDIVYTIGQGVTVTRGASGGRIDFAGNSNITVNGTLDLFGTEDGVSSSRLEDNASITINSTGTLKLKDTTAANSVIILRGATTHLNVQGGTVDVHAIELEGATSLLTAASGSTVNFAIEPVAAFNGTINFTDKSTGTIDIATHSDALSAETYWKGLWDTGKLTYNGLTNLTYAGTRAVTDFGTVFEIDENNALNVASQILTPTIGLDVTLTDSMLTWTVKEERDVREYSVTIDGETIAVIPVGDPASYIVDLSEYDLTSDSIVELVIVDHSGFSKTYTPSDGNITTENYDLVNGWNLIAVTGNNADLSAFGTAWTWNGYAYEVVTTVEPTQAVWVYSDSAKQVSITSEKSDAEITLSTGWNMVGPISNCNVPADAHAVYSWNQVYEEILVETGTLIGGVGYWIFKSN